MIDLHCHILPGIDDGATEIVESLALARAFVDEGVRTVAANAAPQERPPRCDSLRAGRAMPEPERVPHKGRLSLIHI